MIVEAQRSNVGSVCTVLPTLLRPRTRITHCLYGLKRLYPFHDEIQVPTLLSLLGNIFCGLVLFAVFIPFFVKPVVSLAFGPFSRLSLGVSEDLALIKQFCWLTINTSLFFIHKYQLSYALRVKFAFPLICVNKSQAGSLIVGRHIWNLVVIKQGTRPNILISSL